MIKIRCLILMFAALLLSVACDSSSEHQQQSKKTDKYGGTLVIGISSDVDTFNPLFTEAAMGKEIGHLLLRGLADLNDHSEFVGELAEWWKRSDDYRQVTYHLRKDARWSDGVPITAEDVQFTFELLADTAVASPNNWVTDFIQKVVVVDSHTVRIEFCKAYPDQIFDTAGEILPRHILKDVDRRSLRTHAIGREPLSSGPYKLKKWVAQQVIELVPNEHYYGRRPYLDRLVFKIVPDKSNLQMQLESGEIDMIADVDAERANLMQKNSTKITVYPISGRTYYYIGYNEKNSIFSKPDVRRALAMAVDRRTIIDALLYGFGEACNGPIPPMLKWDLATNETEVRYDPAAAQDILTTAGWSDSNGDGWLDRQNQNFEFTLQINSGNKLKEDLAVVLQAQLKKIGVKVNLETIEWTAFLKKLRQKQFDAYVGGWSTSFNVDFTPIFHSQSGELFNYVSYANPEVDQLIEAGRVEMDRKRARDIWMKAQSLIYAEQPYTFLFWKPQIVAVNSEFKDVTPIPLSVLYNIENWYLDSPNAAGKLATGPDE